LRTLKITVEIPLTRPQEDNGSESEENSMALRIVEELFLRIYKFNPNARLEHLEVSFLMQNRGSAWSPIKTVEVRRKERDDAPRPWEIGGYDANVVV
jgi:hypothetical protein